MPRSGSTLLNDRLARYSNELFCLPEWKGLEIVQVNRNRLANISAEQILQLLQTDPRWPSLQIIDDTAIQILNAIKEKNPASVFTSIVSHLIRREQRNPQVVVAKNGTAIWLKDEIIRDFPDACFLHIHRDPRAVISSMMSNYSAFNDGARFSYKNEWGLINKYNNYRKDVKRIDASRIMEIAYEDVMADEAIVLQEIANYLGVKRASSSSWFSRSEKEKLLHKNVDTTNNPAINEAWKTSLDNKAVALIERYCEPYLQSNKQASGVPISNYLRRQQLANMISPMYRMGRAIKRYSHPNRWHELWHRIRFLWKS